MYSVPLLDAIHEASKLVAPDDDEMTAVLLKIWNIAYNLTSVLT